jgi:hypothetical protein|nr:MAG TPA_asm: GcrA cell cycle regulator [Caudoviricetes sp.]
MACREARRRFFDEIIMNEIYHKRWRPEEERLLTKLYMAGHTPESIAERMGRVAPAVKCKIQRLGLHRRQIDREARIKLECMPNPFKWMK